MDIREATEQDDDLCIRHVFADNARMSAPWAERDGHAFRTLGMAIAAAIGGLGGDHRPAFYRAELASGALVAPSGLVHDEGTGYFVAARDRLAEPNLQAFLEWLLAATAG